MFEYIAYGPGTSRLLDAALCWYGNAPRMPKTINPLELTFTLYDYEDPEILTQVIIILDGPMIRLSDRRVSKWYDQPGYKFNALFVGPDGQRTPVSVEYWLNGNNLRNRNGKADHGAIMKRS